MQGDAATIATMDMGSPHGGPAERLDWGVGLEICMVGSVFS